MQCSRRSFLLGATGLVSMPFGSSIEAGQPEAIVLEAKPGSVQLLPPDYPETGIWGYGGAVPGPAIRATMGDRARLLFRNSLPQPSTIHWHGIRIDNAMDGVPELTQDLVNPGEEFLYEFDVPDAGTFWYHTHHQSWEQLARGLYGALIVEEATPPVVDREETLIIDDWRLQENGDIHDSFGNLGDWSHAGRLGNWVTVNGLGEVRLKAAQHERIRLRLINAANARVFHLLMVGMEVWLVALDGQPVETPYATDSIVLAPAQRADFIVDITAPEGNEAILASNESENHFAVASFDIQGRVRDAQLAPPEALTPNPVTPIESLADSRTVALRMEGGAMGSLASAMTDGQEMSIRDLVERGLLWAFNGVAEAMPTSPLLSVSAGETVRIAMANDTRWPHAMHLHGHHFREVGEGEQLGPLRDTILVDPLQGKEIAFVADNPGDWLFHCHMVEHAPSGMNSWIRVT